jgi:hypothetical protein
MHTHFLVGTTSEANSNLVDISLDLCMFQYVKLWNFFSSFEVELWDLQFVFLSNTFVQWDIMYVLLH